MGVFWKYTASPSRTPPAGPTWTPQASHTPTRRDTGNNSGNNSGFPTNRFAMARSPTDPSTWGKVGRNEACPCGSGKKFKHCHGALV